MHVVFGVRNPGGGGGESVIQVFDFTLVSET